MMNKVELHKFLIERQQQVILLLKEKIATNMSMVDIDEGDTIDPEDLSHQSESFEIKLLFEQKLKKAEADLKELEKIDFSKREIALPGAVVSTEKFNFFLGFPTIPFDFEDKKVVGVSIDSPIYQEMKGKKAGDTFSFTDKKYTIIDIQ